MRRCLPPWHKPLWSSGTEHGSAVGVLPLRGGRPGAVLNGHERNYERFRPPSANFDAAVFDKPRRTRCRESETTTRSFEILKSTSQHNTSRRRRGKHGSDAAQQGGKHHQFRRRNSKREEEDVGTHPPCRGALALTWAITDLRAPWILTIVSYSFQQSNLRPHRHLASAGSG